MNETTKNKGWAVYPMRYTIRDKDTLAVIERAETMDKVLDILEAYGLTEFDCKIYDGGDDIDGYTIAVRQ